MVTWYKEKFGSSPNLNRLAVIYLSFLQRAQRPDGRFHNFADDRGQWIDSAGSEDSFGRALWGLGEAIRYELPHVEVAQAVFDRALDNIRLLHHPRSEAFALVGCLARGHLEHAELLARKLISKYERTSSKGWSWFTDRLTHSNGILPYALLLAAKRLNITQTKRAGLQSLKLLNSASRVDSVPAPIGNKGWYRRGRKRALFDQQPIEAADMVLANRAAYRLTGEARFKKEATDWFRWFYGFNVHGLPLVSNDGGCYDALTPKGVNTNRGAESTIAYLLAHLALSLL